MRSCHSIALLAALAVMIPVGVARADVPPPDDYVDPCKSAALDESCQRCVSPEFKNPDCHAKAREGGLVQRCQGWSYTMYCREGGAAVKAADAPAAEPAAMEAVKPAEAPAATPPAASCSAAGSGSGGAVGGMLLVVVGYLRRGRVRGRGGLPNDARTGAPAALVVGRRRDARFGRALKSSSWGARWGSLE